MFLAGIFKSFEKKAMRASLAAPSTGAAASFTINTGGCPPRPSGVAGCQPARAVRPARGVTRTLRIVGGGSGLGNFERCSGLWRVERPRTVQEHLVVTLLLILLVHELERIA